MDKLLEIAIENWQSIAVAAALTAAAIRAAWNEWQRRQAMASSRRAAEQESQTNVRAMNQAIDGLQAISEAKDEATQAAMESFEQKHEALMTDKQSDVEALKKDPKALLDRISKLTGAKNAKK
jgi:hypothetical protein